MAHDMMDCSQSVPIAHAEALILLHICMPLLVATDSSVAFGSLRP